MVWRGNRGQRCAASGPLTASVKVGKSIREAVADDAWLDGDFIGSVQQRGAAIIKVSCCLTHGDT